MAEGFSQSASREMDKSGPSRESELVPLIEHTKCTTTEGNLECSPTNLNVFSGKEKTKQKSLYTEILEAEGRSSGEGPTTGESALSEVSRDMHAIVTSAAAPVEDEMTGSKQCNLPAASASEGIGDDQPTTSSSVVSRDYITETELEACELAEDARCAAFEGCKVVAVVHEAIQRIKQHKKIAEDKVIALSKVYDEPSERELRVQVLHSSRCSSALNALRRKIDRLEYSIEECENAAKTALECVSRGDEGTDALHLKTLIENAIIDLIKKENDALRMVSRIWCDSNEAASDSSSGRTECRQQSENAERNIKLGHFLGSVVGTTLLGMTATFHPKYKSVPPSAFLGGAIILCTSVFWINRFRKRIQRWRAGTEATPSKEPTRLRLKPYFMEFVERRLSYTDGFLEERGMIPRFGVEESDLGSMVTLREEDV